MTFTQALKGLEELEGGWTVDAGGPTECGITQSAWDQYCSSRNLPGSPVRTLSRSQITDFYWFGYWQPLLCDQLPDGVDFVLFQWAVNHEPAGDRGGSVKSLQVCCGVEPDGVMGQETVVAARIFPDSRKLMSCILARQESWYEADARENPDAPLVGWQSRISKTKTILGLQVLEGELA